MSDHGIKEHNNLLRRSPTLRHGAQFTLSTPPSSFGLCCARRAAHYCRKECSACAMRGKVATGLRVDPLRYQAGARARFLCEDAA